eukprot:TRINITY_DN1238_c0_g1_i1.p1 TRINITY_DN1238_c0_g1~~TRINITY_DN1238_c0_g1_i1.p1  ORF type:complete len:155 (+),score=34.36 TRINITY_DN1238_c0_g1_i1:96-560(+)
MLEDYNKAREKEASLQRDLERLQDSLSRRFLALEKEVLQVHSDIENWRKKSNTPNQNNEHRRVEQEQMQFLASQSSNMILVESSFLQHQTERQISQRQSYEEFEKRRQREEEDLFTNLEVARLKQNRQQQQSLPQSPLSEGRRSPDLLYRTYPK